MTIARIPMSGEPPAIPKGGAIEGVTQPVNPTPLPIDRLPAGNVIVDPPTYTKTQTKQPIAVSIERAIPLALAAGSSAYGLSFAATPDLRPAVLAFIGAFAATLVARIVEGVVDQGASTS